MNAEELYYEYEFVAKSTLHKMFRHPVKFAQSMGLEYDDLLQFSRMGLWQAACTYREDKQTSTFRSFAIRNVRWKVYQQIKKYSNQCLYYKSKGFSDENNRVKILSINCKIGNNSDEEREYEEIISSDNINNFGSETPESEFYSQTEYNKLMKMMTKKEKDLLQLKMAGFTYEEIGEMYGLTKQAIGMRVRKNKNKINRYTGVTKRKIN